jgi:DNA-binding transcriptional LysR family regulator
VPLGLDIAIRIGELKSSNLIARAMGQFDRHVVASYGYVAAHSAVAHPDDLKQHTCLRFFGYEKRPWKFIRQADSIAVVVSGGLTLSTGDSLRDGVLAGLGIALTPSWFWGNEINSRTIVRLLPDYQAERQKVHAVSAHRHAADSKEFAFIEFVKEIFRPHAVD